MIKILKKQLRINQTNRSWLDRKKILKKHNFKNNEKSKKEKFLEKLFIKKK